MWRRERLRSVRMARIPRSLLTPATLSPASGRTGPQRSGWSGLRVRSTGSSTPTPSTVTAPLRSPSHSLTACQYWITEKSSQSSSPNFLLPDHHLHHHHHYEQKRNKVLPPGQQQFTEARSPHLQKLSSLQPQPRPPGTRIIFTEKITERNPRLT